MSLQSRILLFVTTLLIVAVVGTTAILTWTNQQAMLAQTEEDGQIIASLLARSAGFADQIPQDVEAVIGDQMIAGATLTSYLVAVAEEAGYSPDEIADMLRDVTNKTQLAEVWVTDEMGHAYITTEDIDFTFSPDREAQPQASEFWPLLTGEATTVVQEAQKREIDDGVFKYVGVGGVDKPRIVELGTSANLLDQLAVEMGPARLADEIVASGGVSSIRIVDYNFTTIAYSGVDSGAEMDWQQVTQEVRGAITAGQTTSHQTDTSLEVVTPILDADDRVNGAVLVSIPMTRIQDALRENLRGAVLVAAGMVILGGLASVALARWVTQPVGDLTTAAAAIEANTFDPGSLESVARRADDLGQLGRVFQRMAEEVQAREARLKAQLQDLRIEVDRTQEARQVAEITETDYFQDLQAKARHLRDRSARRPASPRET